jgi:tetratricopeptide (TPR) repeat protein
VTSYEALKDHAPRSLDQLELPERRFVARAYRQQKQGERASALVLDLCHLLLADEARLAAFYRGVNRPYDAQRRLSRALLEYPDTDPIVAAWFGWARTFLDLPRPPEATAAGAPRPKFWKPDGAAARDAMLEEAYVGLKDFVAWFPTHALAPEAQQLATDALSRLGDDEGVAREADLFARRYPQDLRVDDVLVLRLRALARLNRFDDALACGQLVLAWRERRSNDSTTASPFCDEVLHTFARLHHQRGELKQAVKYYAQVAGRIPDARDALEYFTAPRLELPEVVTVEAGQEARLPVKSKNIEKLAFKVYPVDFMILFLTRLDLANIHDIDLTGITPLVQREAALGATDDLAWKDAQVPLPAKDAGVYLVVGKAGALDRSALVVVSDLRIDVQKTQGRVRVYARTKDGKPAPGARVRVTDGSNLVARGTTDARGVFDGEVRSGRPLSVVAEREGHYALFREQRQ